VTDLHGLVYVSTAAHPLSLHEIEHILERAQARNGKVGVTGVLLYSDGTFMQYLEGSAVAMKKVYTIIQAHPLHHGIIELLREPIASREFPEWSMAFRSASTFAASNPSRYDALLSQKLASPGGPGSTARTLLSKFWSSGRVPHAF
jgi:Sensors of blue-light using FAD